MQYKQAVDYIHSLLAFGIKPGLERIQVLLDELGNPQNDLRFIHVAGTNGKGSTSTMLSCILKAAGYKTGLFTSPYVFSFCERIQINNENIPEADLARVVAQVKSAIEILNANHIVPTEFEAITAAALLYFKEQNCDYAVMEVGLGGRYDSTNIIPAPEACVLTSISLDHTKILGDTVEQIAAEKAGILKQGSVCVTTTRQDPNALSIIRETAAKQNCTLHIADAGKAQLLSESLTETVFAYDGGIYTVHLTGQHQIENAVGVIEAAKHIADVKEAHIREGLQNTVMRGRMEYREGTPSMLLDGGHNPECAEALSAVLKRFAPEHITAVIGMMADKDVGRYLETIAPLCKVIYFTKPNNPRAAEPAHLQATIRSVSANTFTEEDPKSALQHALESTPQDGLVLICGSFYLLSDLFT